MAIYHLSVKTVSRSAGRSATAAAAYRSGVSITDSSTGEIHDYRRKGGVQSATLVIPSNAPEWAHDRGALWNAAEQAEKRKNSTVAREFEIALPSELSPAERQRLAVDFARELVERHGCAADVAIHAPGKEGDSRNHHAHILLTTRRLTPQGMGEKTRELDDQTSGKALVTQWRERFATLQNERLREAGHAVQVDHRSHAQRGMQAMPTWHLGPVATAIERRSGQHSRISQDFEQAAAERLRLLHELGQLERQAKSVDRSILNLSGDLQAEKAAVAAKRTVHAPSPTPAPVRPPAARLDPAEAEKQRLSRMTSAELAEEIRRRQLPSVDSLVEQDRQVMESTAKRRELDKQQEAAQAFVRKAEQALHAWREKHPLKVKMHDAGVFRSAELLQLEQQAEQGQQTLKTLQAKLQAVSEQDQQLRRQARSRVIVAQSDDRQALEKLEQLRQDKARQELAAAVAKRELEAVPQEFRRMAASREAKALGWSDRGGKWQAAPEQLKKLIDGYNAAPKEARAAVLARLTTDKASSQQLRTLLDTQKANYRENDRGISR